MWLGPVVYSRETATVITIVANSTTYDARVAQFTCFVYKQGKATIQHAAAYEPEPRKELITSWEQAKDTALGNAVADGADSV